MTAADWDKVYEGHFNRLGFTYWNGLNIGRLTLAIWILASHLALIIFLLGKSSLRRQPKNILIVSVSLANLITGAFLVPGKLHFILAPMAVDCQLSVAWTLMNDYFQVCVSLLTVFGVVMERLVYVFTESRGQKLNQLVNWFNCALYFILPWVTAVILVVPMFYEALVERVPETECAFTVHENYFLALQVVSFLPAATAVFLTAPLAGLLDCLRSKKCAYIPSTPRGESLVIACLASILAVFGESPFFIVRMLIMCLECNHPSCSYFNEGITASMWIRVAKAAAFPFLWLVYSDLRDAMLCRLHYKKVKNENIEDEDDHVLNTKM